MSLQKLLVAARYAMNNGDWKSAENWLLKILDADSANSDVLDDLADALYYQGRLPDAEIYYRVAVADHPMDLNLRIKLARYYLRLEYDSQALDILNYVLGQSPRNEGALLLLPDCLRRLGRIDEAHARAKQLILYYGHKPRYYFYLAGILRQTMEYSHLEKLQPGEDVRFSISDRRLRTRHIPSLLADALDDAGKKRLQSIASSAQSANRQSLTSAPGKRKYHVGFVCQELRDHPVGHYFLPLLRAYAATYMPDLRIHIYNAGDDRPNDRTYREIKALIGPHFRSIKNTPMDLVLETIRGDGIDVLFDLGGHSPRAATWLFDAHLAAVQIMWLGWGHTMGESAIDYLLVDKYCAPTDMRYIAEQPAVIDAPYMILPQLPKLPDHFVPPVDRNGYVTFGQPNRFDKWTMQSMARDAKIMTQVPGSRLFIFHPDASSEAAQKNIRKIFADHGVDSTRIEFLANSPQSYGDCMAEVDLVLDPIAVSGGATALDILSYGIPLLTQAGDQLFQRFSYGFLQYAGLGELCAQNSEDFIARAVSIANVPEKISALRGGYVREKIASSPLLDLPAYGAAWNRFIPQLLDQHDQKKIKVRA